MKAILSVVVAAMALSVSAAVDYYVAAGGNDANDGLSPATAKATIAAAYIAMTNGTAEATAGNRLIVGAGEFDMPSETIVLANGQSVVGSGRESTRLNVTSVHSQFALTSSDCTLRSFEIDFKSMDMKNIAETNTELSGALANNPKGMITDLSIVNYKTTWHGTLLRYEDAASSPVVSNCVIRNFHITYRRPLIDIKAADAPVITHTSFIDGTCGPTYWTPGTIRVDNTSTKLLVRNCQFLRVANNQDTHSGKYATGTISGNAKSTLENCSFIDCRFVGNAFATNDLTWVNLCGPVIKFGNVVNTLVYGCTNQTGQLQPCRAGNYSYCASEQLLEGEGNVQITSETIDFQYAEGDRYIPVSGPTVNAAVELDWMAGSTDIRGRDRVEGTAPDIGCYEYYTPRTIYVSTDGDDENDGLSLDTAKATVAGGYEVLTNGNSEATYGDRLHIAEGEFIFPDHSIVLENGQSMTGSGAGTILKLPADMTQVVASNVYKKGMIVMKSRDAKLEGLTVDFNNVPLALGGALFQNPDGKISDCIFTGYTKPKYMRMYGTSMIFFDNNTVAPMFRRCKFLNGVSPHIGSIVYVNSEASPIFDGCSFTDFTGGHSLGAVWVRNQNSATVVRNCLFARFEMSWSNNSAQYTQVIYTDQSKSAVLVDNCTIVDCVVSGWDAAVKANYSNRIFPITGKATVSNTLIYNIKRADGTQIPDCGSTYWCRNFNRSASDYGLSGENNILLSPGSLRFRKPWKGDYTVVSGPTVDVAVELDWMTAAKDLLGRDRVIGGAPDIGCYEFDPKELLGMQVIFR
jgi:hypothetical protein